MKEAIVNPGSLLLEGRVEEYLEAEAYRRYKFDWLAQRSYCSIRSIFDLVQSALSEAEDTESTDLADVFEERGFDGELYACFDEFCDSEFLDAQYMYRLLPESDARLYQLWRLIDWIDEQEETPDADGYMSFKYGVRVPNELKLPNQLCWTWPDGTTKSEIVTTLKDSVLDILYERRMS